MIRALAICAAVATSGLAGCAALAPPPGWPGLAVRGDSERVKVTGAPGDPFLYEVARRYCAARGRVGRVQAVGPDWVSMACDLPPDARP